MNGKPTGKARDLGCACGRSSFELARQFNEVEGVDFSANFIRLGVEMAEQGAVRYALAEEGELVSYHTRTLEEHTPKDEWIGGYKKDGENHTTLDGLKEHLGSHFRLVFTRSASQGSLRYL